MRAAAALVWAGWRTTLTYRVDTVLSLLSLVVSVVPVYFIADALQPMMAGVIQAEGDHYFGFLIVGMIAFSFLSVSVQRIPSTVASGIRTGTFEALVATPASLTSLLTGLSGYGFLWTCARAGLLLLTGWVLGARIEWAGLPGAGLVLVLIVLAHVPFGLLAAASVMAFRTTGPLTRIVLAVSGLLGGVYYPTHVIPSWLEYVSAVVPLTYGLRALRKILLEGLPLSAVAGDVAILLLFIVGLFAVGGAVFSLALRYGRRTGSLAQY